MTTRDLQYTSRRISEQAERLYRARVRAAVRRRLQWLARLNSARAIAAYGTLQPLASPALD